MKILITGGAGFLGTRLARALLARKEGFALAGGPPRAIEQILIADRALPPADIATDPRVRSFEGDLLEQLRSRSLPVAECELIFHLAAAVSGECEADLDLGLRSNIDATLEVLQACRQGGHRPVLVFSSSVAVFGQAPGQPMPLVIDDATMPTPQNSYGIQKVIGEQLVADFTRKGHVRGRSVRLMTVSVRPGRPNGAASSFLSAILREPLAGQRTTCPVAPDTTVALASPGSAIRGLLRAADAGDDAWEVRTAVNLPALTTTVREMVDALRRVAAPEVDALIDWVPDPHVAAIVTNWPSRVHAGRAMGLGLAADADFDSILREYMDENPDALDRRILRRPAESAT